MVEVESAESFEREKTGLLSPDYANETIPEIKTKEGGRKSTIRKAKCLNAICQGKGVDSVQQGHKKVQLSRRQILAEAG